MSEKIENYKSDLNLSVPQRIATYLDYCAKVAPGRPVKYQQITKVVEFCNKMPTEKDYRVVRIKKACSRAQKHLRESFNRGLVSHPGYGVRATFGDEDFAKTRFQTDKRRFISATKNLDISQSMIKPGNIQDKDLRNSVLAVRSTFKVLVQHDVINKLQLPTKTDGSTE